MKRIAAAVMAVALVFLMAGCVGNSDMAQFKSKDGDWSVSIPKGYTQEKEVYDEQLKSHTVTFRTEKEPVFLINEIVDEKLEINEEKLKEEFSLDNYLHAQRFETIDIENIGKAYGALVDDEATNTSMLYYRIKYKDKAISFISYCKDAISPKHEAEVKAIISTLKGL